MHAKHTFTALINNKMASAIVTVILASLLLAACDNNSSSSKTILTASSTVRTYDQAATLRGEVSNKKGPVTSGELSATDEKGKVISTTKLESSGRYAIEIPAGTPLPILLTVGLNLDKSNSKALKVAVIEPTLKKYDINLLTTAIAKKAKAMGGYTFLNMRQAAMTSTSSPDANKTTGGFKGDPTKQYGGWH